MKNVQNNISDLNSYIAEIDHVVKLSRKEMNEIINTGKFDRDRLIAGNLHRVANISKNYIGSGMPILDIIQEGNIALIDAIDKIQSGKKYDTVQYITRRITMGIEDFLYASAYKNYEDPIDTRYRAWVVCHTYLHPNYWRHFSYDPGYGKIKKIGNALNRLIVDLERYPSIEEVAENVDMPVYVVRHIVANLRNMEIGFDDINDVAVLDDSYWNPVEYACKSDCEDIIENALARLTQQQRRVIELRYGSRCPHTYSAIAKEMQCSTERIRQVERAAIRRLRRGSTLYKLNGLW